MNKKWKKFRRLLRDYENIARIEEMKHSYPPEDWAKIEKNFKEAKSKLVHFCRVNFTSL